MLKDVMNFYLRPSNHSSRTVHATYARTVFEYGRPALPCMLVEVAKLECLQLFFTGLDVELRGVNQRSVPGHALALDEVGFGATSFCCKV